MLYKLVGGATITIASLCILTQIVLLPLIFQYSTQLKSEFASRIRKFHRNARQFDDNLSRLRQLGIVATTRVEKRAVVDPTEQCPPPIPGPQGPPGLPADDGEQGDAGLDGSPGLDAYHLLLEEAKKCIECPAGPHGEQGPPGPQGYQGLKGDKGETGQPGKDGIDGEQGPPGLIGLRGKPGKPGKKGVDGSPAPGGQGAPGLPGVKGPLGEAGAQGERGKRNYVIGPPGPEGRQGENGMDGIPSKPGPRGEKGPKGEEGADAKFCPCSQEMSMAKKGDAKKLSPPGGESKPGPPGAHPPGPTSPLLVLKQQQSGGTSTSTAKVPTSMPVAETPLSGAKSSPQPPQNAGNEDAYPNYEHDEGGVRGSENNHNSIPNYDVDDVGSPGAITGVPHRKFVYVTKRPRA